MANVNNVTQLLPTAHEGYVDNLSASISSEAATVPVNSASAYQDGDVVVLTVDPGTPEEATFTGTKASSPDRFVNCKWTEGNIGAGHASGAAVVDYVSATHYNLLAKALKGVLNQDGSYKSSVLESILNVNKRTEDLFGDFLVQAPITDTTGLAQTYGEVIGYIGGARIKADSGAVKVLTATSDNYVSFDNTGAINVTALAVGSAQPSLPANSLWLGKYTTDASSITASDESLRVTSPIATKSIQNKAVTAAKVDWSTVGMAGGTFAANVTTRTITGLGFKPKEVEFTFSPGTATTALYFSSGWSIDDGTSGGQHRSTAIYGAGSGTGVSWRRVSSAGYSIILTSGSSTFVQGKVTEWNDDGFVVTFNSTGSSSDTFDWKARQ